MPCPYCKMKFPTNSRLRQHQLQTHPGNFSFLVGSQVQNQETAEDSPVQNQETPEDSPVQNQETVEDSRAQEVDSEGQNRERETDPYLCISCDLNMVGFEARMAHNRDFHAGTCSHCCPYCSLKFNNNHQVSDHIRSTHQSPLPQPPPPQQQQQQQPPQPKSVFLSRQVASSTTKLVIPKKRGRPAKNKMFSSQIRYLPKALDSSEMKVSRLKLVKVGAAGKFCYACQKPVADLRSHVNSYVHRRGGSSGSSFSCTICPDQNFQSHKLLQEHWMIQHRGQQCNAWRRVQEDEEPPVKTVEDASQSVGYPDTASSSSSGAGPSNGAGHRRASPCITASPRSKMRTPEVRRTESGVEAARSPPAETRCYVCHRNVEDFSSHSAIHRGLTRFSCTICTGSYFPSHDLLRMHWLANHEEPTGAAGGSATLTSEGGDGEKQVNASVPTERTAELNPSKPKSKPKPSKRKSLCYQCHRQVDNLKQHLHRAHVQRKMNCTECGQCFLFHENLKKHWLEVHHKQKPRSKPRRVLASAKTYCYSCDLSLSYSEMLSHKQRCHYRSNAPNHFECPRCPLVFDRSREIEQHCRVMHNMTRPGSAFETAAETGTSSNKCPRCPAVFEGCWEVERHCQVVHNMVPVTSPSVTTVSSPAETAASVNNTPATGLVLPPPDSGSPTYITISTNQAPNNS